MPDLYSQGIRNVAEARQGRRIDSTFDQANEINRIRSQFRKLLLAYPGPLAQKSNPQPKLLLKRVHS